MSAENNHKIEITYVGGTIETLNNIPYLDVERLIAWTDNYSDKSTFKINIIDDNRTALIRKDLILFINIY